MSNKSVESFNEWLSKLERYCAYTERCSYDVKLKMKRLNIPETEWDELLSRLSDIKMYDDHRYAQFLVSSKINVKKDGIRKIYYALKNKQIDEAIIDNVLSEYNREAYDENLKHIITKKRTQLSTKYKGNDLKQRLMRYLAGKGYRYEEYKDYL